jgi:hypothetical protein
MKLQEIPLTHPLAVPLTYPLLFLHGEHGWGLNGIPYSTAAVQQRFARARGFVTFALRAVRNKNRALNYI